MSSYLLCIDQGTTSSHAVVFDDQATMITSSQKEFAQHFPEDGWVEHDAEVIWNDTVSVCRDALFKSKVALSRIAGIGITNQRETTVVWDRRTGKPIYRAIVWQDRRTSVLCRELKATGHEAMLQRKTGLLLDPYFSATKLRWILDHVKGARKLASQGHLAFGTIDCYLLWLLTGGKVHATDITNASRTALFNIHTQQWDDELLTLFNIPASVLPQVKENSTHFGDTQTDLFGTSIPICGMAGDQQAAAIGQVCFAPGMMKSTYGTGAFMLLNTGAQALTSKNRLLTTIGYQLQGQVHYALEGSVFIAGAAMQWLRDNIHFLQHARDSQALAESVTDTLGVYVVPAFTGLGAPYWEPDARGAIFGLTRDTSIAHITRATLESVAYQTRDLLTAMQADGSQCHDLRVDGGMVANSWFCQNVADTIQVPVTRPVNIETTVLGAAFLAGLHCGLWDINRCQALWRIEANYTPQESNSIADKRYAGWQKAVNRLID